MLSYSTESIDVLTTTYKKMLTKILQKQLQFSDNVGSTFLSKSKCCILFGTKSMFCKQFVADKKKKFINVLKKT